MKTKYCILIIRFKMGGGGGGGRGQVIFLVDSRGGGGGGGHCIKKNCRGVIQNNGSKFQPPPDTQIMSSPLRPNQRSFSYVGTALSWLKDKCVLLKDTTL